jgi:hypothetical protein
VTCHEVKSFYSGDDDLRSINLDLVFLVVDVVIFAAILILIESGVLKRVSRQQQQGDRMSLRKISPNF